MDDFAAFMADRYDEAEALARDSGGYLDSGTPEELAVDLSHFTWRGKSIAPSSIAYIAMHRPQNRLADIKLKRAILAGHRPTEPHPAGSDVLRCAACLTQRGGWQEDWHADPYPCATVRQLGTEFAEHAAYKQEWRPE